MAPIVADVAAVPVTLVADPWSAAAWGAQPRWRRLLAQFGEALTIRYVMAPAPRDPGGWALAWLDEAERSGMPVDVRRLLTGRAPNPVPAALAVVAVGEQGDPGPYLRALQEAIFLSRRSVERGDGLLELAREAGGVDLPTLELAFGSSAVVEQLGAERERAAALPAPCVVLGDQPPVGLAEPYERWEGAARAAGAEPAPLPDVDGALRRFGPMTTAEVAAVCGLPGPRAAAELWARAMDWRVTPQPMGAPHVALWTAAA